jgi:arylsulfatase A-like enzyme
MTEMDAQAGRILAQLEEDGLTEDTIIFYYGDHGPGIARSKRYPYNSGLLVPLIVYIPRNTGIWARLTICPEARRRVRSRS